MTLSPCCEPLVAVRDWAVGGRGETWRPFRLYVAPAYLALLVWWIAAGYLYETCIALVSLACHELAHLFVLAGYDVGIRGFEVHPFGALIRYEGPAEGLGYIDALVAAAGPLQSFLLAAVGQYLAPLEFVAMDRMQFFIQVNLLLACFNLLPVWPLDGGRIVRGWLAPRVGDGEAVRRLSAWGQTLGLVMAAVSIAASVALHKPLWVPAMAGAFLWRAARRDRRTGQATLLRTVNKGRRVLRGGVGAATQLVAREDATLRDILRRLRQDRYHLVLVIASDGSLAGDLTEDQLACAVLELGLEATARQALRFGRQS